MLFIIRYFPRTTCHHDRFWDLTIHGLSLNLNSIMYFKARKARTWAAEDVNSPLTVNHELENWRNAQIG